jgi:glycosyltransferase involved in cell wall biosynthesis
MSEVNADVDLSRAAVIIPALNEEKSLAELLPLLASMGVGRMIVGDNGSTDRTAEVARAHGADVASAPGRGYGQACWSAMQLLREPDEIVVFLDADLSDDPAWLPRLAAPVAADRADLVLGCRASALRDPQAMTLPQHFGTWLATFLIRLGWGYRYRDLGPFRAIRRDALEAMGMHDRAFGWTIEMQIRAVEMHLRIEEIDVPYRARVGQSKISGTIRGVILAGYWILRTVGTLGWTKRSRGRTRSADFADYAD